MMRADGVRILHTASRSPGPQVERSFGYWSDARRNAVCGLCPNSDTIAAGLITRRMHLDLTVRIRTPARQAGDFSAGGAVKSNSPAAPKIVLPNSASIYVCESGYSAGPLQGVFYCPNSDTEPCRDRTSIRGCAIHEPLASVRIRTPLTQTMYGCLCNRRKKTRRSGSYCDHSD